MPALQEKWRSLWPTLLHWLRIGVYIVLGIAGVALALLLVHKGLFRLIAWCFPQTRNFFYDLWVFGAYPTAQFVSFHLQPPQGAFARSSERCDDGFVFLGTDGTSVSTRGPVILDSHGDLVWMSEEHGTVMNFRVQSYQDQDYLTFWAGHKDGAVGEGRSYMLDSNYNVAHTIQAVGHGLQADLHEFQLTNDGSALITIYNITSVDLRPMGWGRPKDGWVEDCIFQEIDIATGELLFQWRAQDWFKPEDTYYWHPFAGYVESIPFDFYHLNSVEKDPKGNYLISSRHFHHVVYINGTSGEPLWILGGGKHQNQFSDNSNGVATGFQWQHNARWLDEEQNTLTLFDNGIAGPLHVDAPYSKGLAIQLDMHNYSATVLHEYVSLTHAKSASMGSVTRLANGNMLLGWGSSAAWSEHTMDGELLCEWHFAAAWSFWWERAKNYRAFKFHGWVGTPDSPPAAKVQDDRLYVSWNGATEVRYWELQCLVPSSSSTTTASTEEDSAEDSDQFEPVETIERLAFESSFLIPVDMDVATLRIAALDGQKQVLRYSDPVVFERAASWGGAFGVVLALCAVGGALAGAGWLLRVWRRRRSEAGASTSISVSEALFGREYRYSKL